MEDWDELLEFLRDPRPEVRKIVAQNIRSYTQSEPHLEHVANKKPDAIRSLVNLLGDDDTIAADAVQALINFTSHQKLIDLMLASNIMDRLMENLGTKVNPLVELKLILVSNLTGADSDAVKQILQVHDEDLKGLHVSKLLGWFLHSYKDFKTDKDAIKHTHWVMAIMANLSANEDGQEILLDESPMLTVLPSLLVCTDVIARGGATTVLKNFIMEFKYHARLAEAEVVAPLLERMSKGVEVNKDIRRQAVEAVTLFSRSQEGMDYFDGCGGKKLLQTALEKEDTPDLKEMLRGVVESLDDVQDVYVMPEKEEKQAPVVEEVEEEEKDLFLPD